MSRWPKVLLSGRANGFQTAPCDPLRQTPGGQAGALASLLHEKFANHPKNQGRKRNPAAGQTTLNLIMGPNQGGWGGRERCRAAPSVSDQPGRSQSTHPRPRWAWHPRMGTVPASHEGPRDLGRAAGFGGHSVLTGSLSSSLSRGEVRGIFRGISSPHSVSEAFGDSARSRKSSLL